MRTIVTRYIGPTNTRGAKMRAEVGDGVVSMPYDHSLNVLGNHQAVAAVMARDLKWFGQWHTGELPTGGYCHVLSRDFERFVVTKEQS